MSSPFSKPGVQPDKEIAAAIEAGIIIPASPIARDQLQPASIDLRLGTRALRLRASFLPGKRGVSMLHDGLLAHENDVFYRLDLTDGDMLEAGCVYLVELQERLRLPRGVRARANPKSSTGRIDVFTRLVTENADRFDLVPAGYSGRLYAEILPRTFPIRVRTGDRLSQLRFLRGNTGLPRAAMELGLDLRSEGEICGYRARRHSDLVDVSLVGGHDPERYWEAVRAQNGRVVLEPEEFYIFSSLEKVRLEALEAAEMAPVALELGEFRAHYAGFFDPGFGADGNSRAVLEMRSRDAPFILEHGQVVALLSFKKMAAEPEHCYGSNNSGNYQGQGLRLAKYFRDCSS